MRWFSRCILCSFLLFIGLIFSKPGFALVTVHVTDTTSAPVQNATITLTNETNQKVHKSTTDTNGTGTIDLTITSVGSSIPQSFALGQNFPNPFNPTTAIPFTLPQSGAAKLIIYNIMGQNIRTLVNGYLSSGAHTMIWDGRDDRGAGVGAGIYFYLLTFGKESMARKMLLMDGNNSASAFSQGSVSSASSLKKLASDTYRVNITGADIEPFEIIGITISDEQSYEFAVARKRANINGAAFVPIPGGTFQMGDESGNLWSGCRPVHSVTVSSFQMSEAEITNAQYCAFLNLANGNGGITLENNTVKALKGVYTGQYYLYLADNFESAYPGNKCWITFSSADNTYSVVPGHEHWPVVAVTWYGSKAFAEYYGCDLPREAEWEYACRGGSQYLYGTDDGTIGSGKANYYNNGPNHPVDVKSYPKNPFNLYDMSGNVWEWCADLYGNYSTASVTDPTGAVTGTNRVVRGGNWDYNESSGRSADRDYYSPGYRYYFFGFRVVHR
jgi:formylglycine-generating enzyme required for sulfatase activity